MRFSTRISLLVTSIFLISFALMAYLGYSATTGMLEQRIRENLESNVVHSMDKIDRMLSERFADLDMIRSDRVLCSRNATPGQIHARLDDYQRNSRIYSSLSFFNLDRIRLVDTRAGFIGEKHPLSEYWPDILGGKDTVMSVARATTADTIIVYFAAKVRDGSGKPLGVVVARMPIDSIYAMAKQAFTTSGAKHITKIELLERDGLILFSNYNPAGMLKERSRDLDAIQKLLADGRGAGSVRHRFSGEDEITAVAREQGFGAFKGNGWILVMRTPVEVAFAEASAQGRRFGVLFLIIGAIMLAMTFLASRAAVKPLQELSAAASEIGRGRLDVAVRVGSNDEIGRLAQAFNAMVRDLRESENRFRELVEMLPQIVYEVDTEGRITFVNRYGLELFGYTNDDLARGLSFLDVFAAEDRQRLAKNMQRRLQGRINENVEYTALKKDGSTFPLLSFSTLAKSGDTVIGIRGIGIDITERKRTEEELRQREWQLAEAERAAHIGSWVWRSIDNKATWTDELFHMLGLRPGEMEPGADTFLQFVHPDDRAVMEKAMRDAWESGKASEFELRAVRKDGEVRFVHSLEETVLDDGGRLLLIRGVVQDVTERRRAEDKLKEGEEKLKTITNTAQDAIVMMDPGGNVSFWNPAAEKIFGFKSAEVLGKELHVLIGPPKYHDAYRKGFSHFRETGAGPAVGKTLVLDGVRKDGTELPIELSLSAIQIRGTWHAVGIIRDITERKQVEEKIKKMNEDLENMVSERTRQLLAAQDELIRKEKLATLGQIAGSVGHELRNPLGVMNNAVYYLQTVLPDADDTVREYLGMIRSEILGAERIVSDLLDAVRTKPPQRQQVRAADLVSQSLEKCRVPERVTIKVREHAQSSVFVDPLQIKQVFINLITNAVDAMPAGGVLEIVIGEDRETGQVRFVFRDQGAGIAPDAMNRLFQPLFTTKARGIGLGLVVVKNLTEANGGKVGVESESGRGAVFTIALPSGEV